MARTYTPSTPQGDIDQSKMKLEDYHLLGGINSKVNLYSNGPAEFRDLSNLNFINTGALTKRPGTTLFPGVTQGVLFTPGGNNAGAITGVYEFSKLNGSSYLIVGLQNNLATALNSGYSAILAYGTLMPAIGGPFLWNFTTYADRLFACNGTQFYRINTYNIYGGDLNAYNYSLPQGAGIDTDLYSIPSPSPYNVGTFKYASNGLAGGLSGLYVYSFAFVNDRGFVGPPSNGVTKNITGYGNPGNYNGITLVIYNVNSAQNLFGATAIQLYRSQIDGVIPAAVTLIAIPAMAGPTFGISDFGIPLSSVAPVITQDFDVTSTYGATITSYNLNLPNSGIQLSPRYLEIYNNQMFMAGFSAIPNDVWWSEIGEPEGVQPGYNFEVRTNDGDRITGMKSYLGSLVITKQKSFHLLSGTDPSNFVLNELSDQYGCLSHRTLIPWNNNLWFLDSKGIMEYNGANIRCVSNKIEPIFNNMNINAALDNAYGAHVKQWNEIWFSIPAYGSTINNIIVVYDYTADSWTHYDGLQAQCLFMAYAGFPTRRPFMGNYTGGLMYFDQSLTSDNDQGITCHFDSIFFSARGQSVQNQYRRFYLDVNPILGFTQPIYMTFKQDFGTTVQVSQTMYQNPFQGRIDFGISSRSIQASLYHYSASLPLVINGFTFESRMQRMV